MTFAPRVRVERGQVGVADKHGTCAGPYEAEQHGEQRRLPAPTRPGHGQHLSGTDLESDTVQSRLVSPRVRETGRNRRNGGVGRVGYIRSPSRGRRRLVQNVEDLLSGADPSALAWNSAPSWRSGEIGLRRQDQDEQRRLQAEMTGQEPKPDGHGDQRHGDAGQKLEHE